MDTRALRKRLGLTQQAFADLVGVSEVAVRTWESGRRTPSRLRQAQLLALDQQHAAVLATLLAPTATADSAPPTAPAAPNLRLLRIGDALAIMGLQDDGKGRRSDRTIRNALKSGALPGTKGPGQHRQSVPEWFFLESDFRRWLATGYHAHRDPRRQRSAE